MNKDYAHSMQGDLISRQDALMEARPEYLNPQQQKLASYNQGWNDAVEEYYDGIRALPSADRPTGRWIDYSDEGYVECPFCHSATTCDGNKDELHFCFSCGARMKGGAE